MTHVREQRKPGRPPANSMDIPTSDRILQVASRLFMELGYEGVSMEKVAEEAEVTKAVVYYYYTSKARLFTEAMLRMMDNIHRRTLEILMQDLPLYYRLLRIMQVRFRIATPLDFNAIMPSNQSVLTEEELTAMRNAEERLTDTLAQAYRKAMDEGSIRVVDPVLAAKVYMSVLSAGKADLDRVENAGVNSDERAEELLNLLWLGVDINRR